jgi:hypothetical protein
MDKAGQASTDCTVLPPSDALKETLMSKLQFAVYPVVAVLALAAAFAAHADGDGSGPDNSAAPWAHSKTRAEVGAELAQARADGSINFTKVTYNPLAQSKSYKTRADVRAEAVAARANGYDAMYREDSGAFYLAQQPQSRDASHVLAAAPAHRAQ